MIRLRIVTRPKLTPEEILCRRVADFRMDPLGFVNYAYDWGHGELLNESGPDVWQADFLTLFGQELERAEHEGGSVQIATRSGHGIGKTALVSWIIQFFMSTRPNPQIVVTANTKEQLNSKTWRELSKWHRLLINKHWFAWTATKFAMIESPEVWAARAIPWSKENSEAFAGTHEKHVLVLMDEGSGIDNIIWEVADGAMTTPGACWIVFGNPTRNSGRFRDCWGKFKHRWKGFRVDSRTAKQADQKKLQEWIEDYGDDSDFARVRIKGDFPRAGSNQFISSEIVAEAKERTAQGFDVLPKVLGVDVARFGDDKTVFTMRQGSKLLSIVKYAGLDTIQIGKLVANTIEQEHPHAVFVDAIGVGAGVVDYLRHTGYDPIEVVGSQTPADPKTYFNLRAEMWGGMREWLKTADLPDDDDLTRDLTVIEFGFTSKMQIQLEKKEDLKKRGEDSPDCADSLATTFASPAVISEFFDEEEEVDEHHPGTGRSSICGY